MIVKTVDCAAAGAREATLSCRALLVLQLYARGYTAQQVDYLLGVQDGAWRLLLHVARSLGVATAEQAAVEARRRKLIL